MSTSTAKPYHHGDLRRVLIIAARDLLGETGVAKLTLRGVAARADVSPAAPYRHFADREALLAAVAEQGFADLAAAITPPGDIDPLAALRAIGTSYLEFAVAEPHLYRLMFGAAVPTGPTPTAEARLKAIFAAALERANLAGVITVRNPGDVMLTMRCLMHGLASMVVDDQVTPSDAADAARRVMDVVDVGLLPR
ncbi:TetR/AcrR family transcriptional regulator [Actinokineospora iranica]|uniref:TetR/AcrR family transcriptional regulator n=1 Tax=Actinokineospora iranica TaxID=1271860 RepID=UPI000A81A673|nr:TetR/AcrR family transcriptional regulator [Actinokineospora iranica]